VIFEDLHWIDPTTLEFLKRTVDTIGDMPVLMVMTSRPNFESPWQDSEVVTTISLDRLDHEHSATLVSHVLAGKSLPHEVVDLIVEKTDGIPLFIEELAKMMVESGLLNEDDGRFVLAGPLPELALPNSLQDLLMARLDRLPAAKELAQIGASIGRQFSHKLLVAVSRLREERVSEGVQQLVAADILTRKGEPPDTTYIFKHALIQDSAYSSLLREKRQKLHSTIAVALEKHWPDIAEVRPETLAHHYTRAGDAQNAITFWHRAADHAAERAAHSDAIQHASQAIDLLDKLADDEQRVKSEIGLRVALGRNQEAVLGYAAPEVEQTFERARDLCETLDETTEQVPVLLGLCVFNLVRANCRVTKELAEQCVRLSEDAGQVDYLIESYAVLTFALCYLGELQESRVVAEKCLALYEARGGDVFMPITAQNPGVAVLSNHAIVLWQLGFPDESEKCIERAFALAEQLGHPINFVQILTHVAELRQLRGEVEEARDNALRSIEMAAEHGYDYWQLLSTMHLGIAKGVLGETMDALAMTNEALNHLGAAGADTNLTYFLCGVAEVQRVAGDADKGVVLLDQAIQQAARSGENFHIALLHIQRGECYLELAAPDENAAEADFVRAMKLARAQQAVMLELRAACRLYRLRAAKGGAEDVRSDLEALVEAIEGGANTTDVIEAKTLLSSSA
jgi:predicted ATPase